MAQNEDPSAVGVDRGGREPIALVGIGCRFPGGANGPEAFWRLLRDGVDAITEVPADRFAIDELYDPAPATPGKIITRQGGFLDHVDLFDASFFGISPREAEAMDPQQRLLLEVAWEALEDGGQVPARLASTPVGVFVGMCYNDYEDLRFEDPQGLDVYAVTGGCRSVAAGRLSYALGLRGPSLAIDAACASSLVALHLACQSLHAGDCPVALAAGVNLILEPQFSIAFSQAQMLAPDGRCKFCDHRADGFVRSEGVGVVVLKPLSRALADGDPIRAVIAGSAINNDGTSGESMMTPGGEGQEAVLRAACRRAGVRPEEVDYVEAHGTGTRVGDPVEIGALAAVYGRGRARRPLRVGSVKTNIGHTEGAAGFAGVIKVAISLEQGRIPASLHCAELNPEIPWAELGVEVERQSAEWPAGPGARRAGVSAFGINGSNAHVILEQAPAPAAGGENAAGEQLLALSARTPQALEELARTWRRWLREDEDGGLRPWRDLAFTAGARRTHHPHRLALVAADAGEVGEQLEAYLDGTPAPGTASGAVPADHRPRVVFVFPGQGSQWPGMARELLEREPVFREHLERCDAVMQRFGTPPLEPALSAAEGEALAERIDVVQPALCAVQIALAELWRWWGVEPAAVVGQSMGEVAAAQVAGALSLEDAARIICRRSRLLRRTSGKGEMALVELSFTDAERALEGREDRLSVAVSSSFRSTVVAGDPAALSELLEELESRGVFCRRIRVDVASHSPQMDVLRPDLLAALEGLQPRPAEVPIYSTVAGRVVDGGELDAAYWVRNLRQPVRFTTALEQLAAARFDVFLEISPHPIVLPAIEQGLADLGAEGLALASLRRQEPERRRLLESLAALHCRGQVIDWERLCGAGARVVRLPSYPWQRQRFWFRHSGGFRLQAAGGGHRLLGGAGWSSSLDPDTRLWQNAVGPETVPWLGDHRVRGTIVLPAAAYLEMVLAAAEEAFGNGSHALEAVSFDHAMTFSEDGAQTIQLAISRVGPEEASFKVSTRRQGAAGEPPAWTPHAEGRIRLATTLPSTANVLPDPLPNPLAGDRFYDRLEHRGLSYGPAFRGVEELRRRDGEALGRLSRTATVRAESGAWTLHPALLDACFQVLVAAMPEAGEDEAETWLPVGVERFCVRERPASDQDLWSHARLDTVGAEQGMATGDVALIDAEGRRLVVAEGLRLRRPEGAGQAVEKLFYHLRWQGTLRPPEPAAIPGQAGDIWLIFADRGGVGAALAERLAADGRRCLLIARGQAFASPAAGHYQLDATRAEDYVRLLEEARRAGAEALGGVIYLWGLDLTAPARDDAQLDAGIELLSCGSVLYLTRALLAAGDAGLPRLWLVTAGSQCPGDEPADVAVAQAPLWGLGGVISQEHPALRCTRVDLEAEAEPAVAAAALFAVLGCDAAEDQIALRDQEVITARLVRGAGAAGRRPRVPVVGREPFRLELAEPGILESLELRAGPRPGPAAGEVEIEVGAAGLNFHDVMMAMGLLPAAADGEPVALGVECAGRITAVGDGVEGLRRGDEVLAFVHPAFARYVTTDARLVAPRPPALGLEQAAGLTAVFVTAYYGLHHLARLQPGERVLIHAASGGVGLAAIQVARWLGAEIFATAGSPEKREFLTRLGIERVMDSRSLEFADQVRERTAGAGVDVVLSALVGEGAARSLSLLAPYGRYLEIGRRELYENRALGLKPFLNNLSYFAIDVKALARQRPGLFGSLLREICDHFTAGTFQPLPVRVFPVSEAAEAFRTLAQARHTGKVVLAFRDQEVRLRPSPTVLRADGTYLITGGLGGLGLCFARWLVERGARHLVLVGRRGATAAAREPLEELAAAGAEVVTARADVADREALAAVVARVKETLPPLRGILHAAGLLADATLEQLDRERFLKVLAPKVDGSWNLHRLTLEDPLDFFVLFSSAAALLGSAGQGNYAAANAFLDALAAQRRAWGLPAMSIAWGPWSEVGLAAAQEMRGQRLAERGVGSFSPDRGLAAFARLLEGDPAYAAVMPLDVAQWCRSHPAAARSALFAGLRGDAGQARAAAPAGGVREALAAATSESERRELVESHLRQQLSQVLRLAPAEIELDKPLRSLGLDSLMAMEIRNRLHAQLDADLPLMKLIAGRSLRELAADLLAREPAPAVPAPPPAARGVTVGEEGALSYNQQGLWIDYQLAPESSAYNVVLAARIDGAVDTPALRRAFRALVDRHPILRTVYLESAGQPVQIVQAEQELSFTVIDAAGLSSDELDRQVGEHARQPFVLEQGPLLRVVLFTSSPRRHVLLLVIHHIAIDSWSLGILLRELAVLYPAARSGPAPDLPAPELDYADFVRWQQEMLSGPAGDRLAEFWRRQLAGGLPELDLPRDRMRPQVPTIRGDSRFFALAGPLVADLRALARQQEATLYATLATVFLILLRRYTGDVDIVVGSPMAGRGELRFREVPGHFVNMVPIRGRLAGNPSFRALLAQVGRGALEAMDHQDYPTMLMFRELAGERAPRFEVEFAFDAASGDEYGASVNTSEAGMRWDLGDLPLEVIALPQQAGQFELSFDLVETGDTISALLGYQSDLFDATTVQRLWESFRTILAAVVADPGGVDELPLLTPVARHQMLVEWPAAGGERGPNALVQPLFEAQAARVPAAVAAVFRDRHLSYGELNRRANRLAHWLRRRGAGPEVRVAVLGHRGLDLLVVLLGILKSGGVYLPLEPLYPDSRLERILADGGVRFLATEGALAARVAAVAAALPAPIELFCWDAAPAAGTVPDRRAWQRLPASDPPPLNTPCDLANVFYTSGSTGQPKGAMVEHRGMGAHLLAKVDLLALHGDSVVAQNASVGFDISIWQFLAALVAGGRVVVYDDAEVADVGGLLARVGRAGVTVLETVPSLLELMLSEASAGLRLPRLRYLISNAETLPPVLARRWQARFPEVVLINTYGATECSDDFTHQLFRSRLAASVPRVGVGRPIAGMRVRVLDPRLEPVAVGAPGQIISSGVGVGRGYLGDPAKTAATMVPDPWAAQPGDRLYLTRDLGRWGADGHLEFLARLGTQVKVRGHRIDLGEVEAVLAGYPGVRQAAAVARPAGGRMRLLGYVVSAAGEIGEHALRDFVRAQLPPVMVPERFTTLAEMPLTPNGKVDRRALPEPGDEAPLAEYVAPRGEIESELTAIWREVLEVRRVGIHDHFFELGGNSLSAVRAVSEIRRRLEVEIRLEQLFTRPTIAALAVELAAGQPRRGHPPIPRLPERTWYPLSPTQRWQWFTTQLPAPIEVPEILRLEGPLDRDAWQAALAELTRRHEVLRTAFAEIEGEAVQRILPAVLRDCPLHDLAGCAADERSRRLREILTAEMVRPFDLAAPPLLRAQLVRLEPEEHLGVINLPHITTDGRTEDLLIGELAELYSAYRSGRSTRLAEPRIRYVDFAHWQNEQLGTPEYLAQKSYWERRFEDLPVAPEPPFAPAAAPGSGFAAAAVDADLTRRLKEVAAACEATLFMILTAAIQALWARLLGTTDVVVGTPSSGRRHPELETLAGVFINPVAVRTRLDGDPTFRELLGRVREASLGAFDHQDYPFHGWVESVRQQRGQSDWLPCSVWIFLNPQPPEARFAELTLTRVAVEQWARDLPPGWAMQGLAGQDLLLDVRETAAGLRLTMLSSSGRFGESALGLLLRQFTSILEQFTAAEPPRFSELDLVPPEERWRLAELSRGEAGPRPDPPLQRLVEVWRQAPAMPVIALAGEVEVATAAQVELADPYRLARFLCRHQVTSLLMDAAVAERLNRALAAGVVPPDWLCLRRVVIVGQPPVDSEFLSRLCPVAVLLPVAAEGRGGLWAEWGSVPADPEIRFVGYPCPGQLLEIVDHWGQPLPVGVSGRLHPGTGREPANVGDVRARWRQDGTVEVIGGDAARARAAAPRSRVELIPGRAYRAPCTARERQLTAAWSQVLRVDRVGVDDDFEALGGTFETAVELSEHLAGEANLLALPERIVELRTVKRLVPVVERSMAVRGDGTDPVALTARQRALLRAALDTPEAVVGSITFAARDPLDPKTLAAAMRLLSQRHDALRTRFVRHGTLWLGTCSADLEGGEDLLTVAKPGIAWSEAVAAERQRLDPLNAPQVRALLGRSEQGEPPRLALVYSRLAIDQASLPVLAADLAAAYRAVETGRTAGDAFPVAAGSFHAWLRLAERLAICREPVGGDPVAPAQILFPEWSLALASLAGSGSRRLAELAPVDASLLLTTALGRALHRAGLAEGGVVAVEDGRRYGPSALPELPAVVGQLGRRGPDLVVVKPGCGPAEVRKQLAAAPTAAGAAEVAFRFVAGSQWLPNDLLRLSAEHRPPSPWAVAWPGPALRVLAVTEKEHLGLAVLSLPERLARDRVADLVRAWEQAVAELLSSSEVGLRESLSEFNPQNVDLDDLDDFFDS